MGHGSRHRKNSGPRKAARIALFFGILTFTGAVIDFAYFAYKSGQCYTASTDVETGEPQRQKPVDSDDCRLIISHSEDHQRMAATIAILAVVIATGAAVRLSNASRRTRRMLLVVEVAVVAVGVVYTILLASVLR